MGPNQVSTTDVTILYIATWPKITLPKVLYGKVQNPRLAKEFVFFINIMPKTLHKLKAEC
jgi:hypothetical protein